MAYQASQNGANSRVQSIERTFLTLPGEVRNNIFAFACEANEAPLELSPTHPCPNELSKGRQFYSLTQVCRQVRTEFLPIHARINAVRLAYPVLESYLNDHVRSLYDNNASIGNIIVDVMRRGECADDDEEYAEVDIFPVIKLCRNASNLRIRFGTVACKWCGSPNHGSELKDTLNAFFKLDKHPALAKYLDDAVVGIKLQYPPCVTIQLRKDYWQEWMDEWKREHGHGKRWIEMGVWCQELGLSVGTL